MVGIRPPALYRPVCDISVAVLWCRIRINDNWRFWSDVNYKRQSFFVTLIFVLMVNSYRGQKGRHYYNFRQVHVYVDTTIHYPLLLACARLLLCLRSPDCLPVLARPLACARLLLACARQTAFLCLPDCLPMLAYSRLGCSRLAYVVLTGSVVLCLLLTPLPILIVVAS